MEIDGVEEILGVIVAAEVIEAETPGNIVELALTDLNEEVDSLGDMLAILVIDSDITGDDEASCIIEVIEGDALYVSAGIAVIVSTGEGDWTGSIVISGISLIDIVGDCETLGVVIMTGDDCDALGIIVMVGMDVIDIAEEGEALLVGETVGVIAIGEVVAEADSVGDVFGNEDCKDGDAVGVDKAPGATPLKFAGVNAFGILLFLNSAGF